MKQRIIGFENRGPQLVTAHVEAAAPAEVTPLSVMPMEELPIAEFEARLPEMYAADAGAVMMRGARYARQLRTEGVKTLSENLIRGEDEVLEGYLRNYLKGKHSNMVMVSHYGAGKTEIISHGHKVIGGIKDENVAHVEATPELRAEQLIGSYQSMTKTIETEDGDVVTETLSGDGNAILHPGVQLAMFDEANRGNPRTLATTGNIVGSRKVELGGKTYHFNDLEATIFAFNPGESLATSFIMPGNLAARASSGVILADESKWDAILDGMDGFEPTPEKIAEVITLPQLHIAQFAVRMVDTTEQSQYLKQSTKQVLRGLRDNGELSINEAPGRVLRQLETTAKAVALMRGNESVDRSDVDKAVADKITGSMAMNGASELDFINDTIDNVRNRIS